MSEWKETTLGEVINLRRGHDLPKQKRVKGSVPIISSSGVTGYHNEHKAVGPGVVTGRYGTIGQVFYVKGQYWPLNTTLYVDDFKGNVPLFVSYFLRSIDFDKYNDKSTVPGINRNHLHLEEVSIPPLEEQHAIASVLSSLDDKIDLLHRQNQTLEQMAETLFRQWFLPASRHGVEEADEGWKEGVLGDLVEVKYGKDHKKLLDGVIPVYGSGGLMRNAEKSLYEGESVLIPRKGTLNNVMYVNEAFWTVDTMFYTMMKREHLAKFVYQFIKQKDLASMNVGSAVPSMTTAVLNNMPIEIPPDNLLERFDKIVSEFYSKIKSNQTQIRTLTALRDTLLPKLMSGEVRVSH